MSLIRISRTLLFSLFVFYYAQGFLYPIGSIIPKICLFIILAISGVYFVKTLLIKNKCSPFYKIWTALLVLNIFGFIFTADFSDTLHTSMLKCILGCMLPFYPFFYFALNDELKASHLIMFLGVMLLITILEFFTNQNIILSDRISNNSDIVNNISYSFVSLLPFVFLIKRRKIISGALMLLIIVFIIKGAKRGAVISGAVGLLMYFYYMFKTIESSKQTKGFLISIIGVSVLCFFAYRTFISNDFLIGRISSISEGNYSERDKIYKTIFDTWSNSKNPFNFLFGYGFAYSLKITGGSYAHNDWLELASNFGLLGVGIYFTFFLAAVGIIFKRGWSKDKQILMFTITLLWFIISLFSMRYTALEGYLMAIIFAYLIGSQESSIV